MSAHEQHERIEELIAVAAIGGLDAGEERQLDRLKHDTDCPECRRLETEYAELAGRLAFAIDPVPLRDGFEDGVVAAALGAEPATGPQRAESGAVGTAERGTGPAAATPTPVGSARSLRVLRPLAAAAAAIALFAGGWAVGASGGEDRVPADARVIAFEGEGAGSLSVAYRPGEEGVYVVGSGLATPPQGKVYEVWMIRDGAPVAGPCLLPEADGSLFAFADAELGTTEAMAVTVEPASCSPAPTSEPVFTATVTA